MEETMQEIATESAQSDSLPRADPMQDCYKRDPHNTSCAKCNGKSQAEDFMIEEALLDQSVACPFGKSEMRAKAIWSPLAR